MEAVERLEAGVIVSGIRFVDMVYHELREYLPDYFEMVVVARREQWQEYGDDDVNWLPLPMKGFDLVDLVAELQGEIARRIKKDRTKPGLQRNKRSSVRQKSCSWRKTAAPKKRRTGIFRNRVWTAALTWWRLPIWCWICFRDAKGEGDEVYENARNRQRLRLH